MLHNFTSTNTPLTGKIFVVGAATLPNIQILQDIMKYDPDGIARLYTTIQAASTACTASANDLIIVCPGHTETVSSSTALSLATAGVTIRGIGYGGLRPTITLDTANTATINVTANNVRIENMIFVANFLAIASCFTLTTATDFQLLNCEFRDTSSVLNFVAIVDTDATSNHADGLVIQGCKRIGAGATTNTTIVKMDGTNNRLQVKGNYFNHAAVTAAGLMIIATGKVVTNMEIVGNVILLVGATNLTTGILITTDGSTNSGYLQGNAIQGLDDTTPILVTAASGLRFYDNKYSSNAGASGFLLPALDS